jgi:hypothetical protein
MNSNPSEAYNSKRCNAQALYIDVKTFRTSVRTSRKTHGVSITKTNQLIIFRKIMTVYCMNDTETVMFNCCAYATSSVSGLRCPEKATKKLMTDVQKYISEFGNELARKVLLWREGRRGFRAKCDSAHGQQAPAVKYKTVHPHWGPHSYEL